MPGRLKTLPDGVREVIRRTTSPIRSRSRKSVWAMNSAIDPHCCSVSAAAPSRSAARCPPALCRVLRIHRTAGQTVVAGIRQRQALLGDQVQHMVQRLHRSSRRAPRRSTPPARAGLRHLPCPRRPRHGRAGHGRRKCGVRDGHMSAQ